MVRKNYTRWLVAFLILGVATCALLLFAPGGVAKKNTCATIQDGTISASTGELITLGYDKFGYNYQAHMFNGRYCDYDRAI